MGTLHKEIWISSGAGSSRAQRASGVYYWYLPDRLTELSIALDDDVVADVARAERALASVESRDMRSTEGIARLLLRSEAVASSRIEGLVIGSNRLLRAELQEREPDNVRYDSRAAAVLGNIHAMERAVAVTRDSDSLSVETLRSIHRALCEGTNIEQWGGVIRTTQNWVGGSGSNPLSAEYVPPAPQEVPALLEDLVRYANRGDVSPVVQAALCHAQFEIIHPFADGNGRTGRALIQVCLMRRGVATKAMPPVSLALATEREEYYARLNAYQHATDAESLKAAINGWVSCFAGAVTTACEDMAQIARDMQEMRKDWERKLGRVRSRSSLELMLYELQAMPVFSIKTMTEALCRTKQAISPAVDRLLDVGIVRQTNRGKRYRVFEAPEVMAEFNMVERRLASPTRDTAADAPTRPVPEPYA